MMVYEWGNDTFGGKMKKNRRGESGRGESGRNGSLSGIWSARNRAGLFWKGTEKD